MQASLIFKSRAHNESFHIELVGVVIKILHLQRIQRIHRIQMVAALLCSNKWLCGGKKRIREADWSPDQYGLYGQLKPFGDRREWLRK